MLSWRLWNTLDAAFCIEALQEALDRHGAPEIFDTDQGSQFTSEGFTDALLSHGVAVSMDGRGRWMDNVLIERLWRSVKYEEVYLKGYGSLSEARRELAAYFDFFNHRRRRQGLAHPTPDEVYLADGTDRFMMSSPSPKNQIMRSSPTRPSLPALLRGALRQDEPRARRARPGPRQRQLGSPPAAPRPRGSADPRRLRPAPLHRRPGRRLLRGIVSERAGHGSFILTANRSPNDWYELFPNAVVAEGSRPSNLPREVRHSRRNS